MTMASKVNHPLFLDGMIDAKYCLYGVVLKFTTHKTTNGYHEIEEERLIVNWLPVDESVKYYHVDPVYASSLTIIRKFDQPNFIGLNKFIEKYLNKKFYFILNSGWRVRQKRAMPEIAPIDLLCFESHVWFFRLNASAQ